MNGSRQAASAGAAILYSFRRCPYAIRARLALAAAGLQPGRDLELREVALQAKPPELLAASSKGTVPVLVLPEAVGAGARREPANPAAATGPKDLSALDTATQGQARGSAATVLDESLAIVRRALEQRDPEGWLAGWSPTEEAGMGGLIAENDGPFKHHLDRFKYAGRFGREGLAERQVHRERGLAILRDWNQRLQRGGWLLGDRPSLADIALLPFVRQFRLADPAGFDAEPGLAPLQTWLQGFLASRELAAVMAPPWAPRSAWRSPGRLYHLALRQDWQTARGAENYRISTRGRSLQEVGFVHLSQAHQVEATAGRFYGDVPDGELLLLHIDPEHLRAEGLEVRLEPAPGSGELFPHLYGPLPLQAVLLAERFLPAAASMPAGSLRSAGRLMP